MEHLRALFSLANAILKLLTEETRETLKLKETLSAVQANFLSLAILVYLLLVSPTMLLLIIFLKAITSFFHQCQSLWFAAFAPCQMSVPRMVL